MRIDHAERARALVGTRYRPQGRGEDGLDCVGVILAVYGIPADQVPRDYALRGDHLAAVRAGLRDHFRRVPKGQLRAGDLLLLRPGDDQIHLAVQTNDGFVHAHARIRRVVETPGIPDWPLIGAFRKRGRA